MLTKRKSITLFILSILALLGLPIFSAQAADPAPLGTPSPPPFQFAGITFVSGFTTQPTGTNTVSGRPFTLSVSSVGPFFQSVSYTWYVFANGSYNWATAPNSDNTNRFVGNIKTNTVSTNYYQVRARYTGLLGNTDYWSNVVKVIVSPEEVHASAISITAPQDTLPNSVQMNLQRVLTPANATDAISWSVDRPDLATIDPVTGALTASSDTTKTGSVQVSVRTANGLSATKLINIGALRDQTTAEGKNAVFAINGFPPGTTITGWHQVTPDGKDTTVSGSQFVLSDSPNGIKDGQLAIRNTRYQQNGYKYYATVRLAGANRDTNTNSGTLTVLQGSQLTLDAVPNFAFTGANGPISIGDVHRGVSLNAADYAKVRSSSSSNSYDGNTAGRLSVYDPRPNSDGWTLSAALTPFRNQSTGKILGSAGANIINLIDDDHHAVAKLPDNNVKTTIF